RAARRRCRAGARPRGASASRRWPTGSCSSTASSISPTPTPGPPPPSPRAPGPLGAEPTRLMKVFWHLHRLGCELSLDLERALEDSLYLADGAFQRSAAVRDLFLD